MHFNFRRTTSLIAGKSLLRLFPVLLMLVLCGKVVAQIHPFPVNGDGEVEYMKLISNDSIPFSILWDNGLILMDSLKVPDVPKPAMEIDMVENAIKNKYGFYLLHKPGLTKQILARVDADIIINIGDRESVITIKNIYFIEYQRNRAAQFKPKNSKKYYLDILLNNDKVKYEPYYSVINEKYENMIEIIGQKLVKY